MWSANRRRMRKGAARLGLVLGVAAVLILGASPAAAETGYHLIIMPGDVQKVTNAGVVLSGRQVIKPALDEQGNPVWDSDGDCVADGYTVTTLQTHAEAYPNNTHFDMNESLDVVGGGRNVDGERMALLWRNVPDGEGHPYTLVELGHPFSAAELEQFNDYEPNSWMARGVAVNDKGHVLVYAGGRWYPPGYSWSVVTRVWAVVIPRDTDGDGKADTWFEDSDGDGRNDLMVDLEHGIAARDEGYGWGRINNRGQVAVWSPVSGQQCVVVPKDTDGDGEPDLWFEDADADGVNDLRTVLQTDLGGRPMEYIDLSESGLVLGGVYDHPSNHAVLWQIHEAGDVEMVSSEKMDLIGGVNSQGLAVGYFMTYKRHDLSAIEFTPILWRPDGSTAKLTDLLDNPGTATNLRPSFWCINDAGCIWGAAWGDPPHVQVPFIALPSGGTEPPPPPTGGIAGVVYNVGGKPVRGAAVTAMNQATEEVFETTTNPKGKYSLDGLPAGDYLVEASKAGVGYDAVSDVSVVGGETITVDLYLQ